MKSWLYHSRRRRDLNSRAGYPAYTLSRGASSATWVHLHTCEGPLHNSQAILYLFYFNLSSLFLHEFFENFVFLRFIGHCQTKSFHLWQTTPAGARGSERPRCHAQASLQGRMVRTTEGNAVSGRRPIWGFAEAFPPTQSRCTWKSANSKQDVQKRRIMKIRRFCAKLSYSTTVYSGTLMDVLPQSL